MINRFSFVLRAMPLVTRQCFTSGCALIGLDDVYMNSDNGAVYKLPRPQKKW
jgi:hypothetical protein